MSEPNAKMSLIAETDFGLQLLGQVANNTATVFSPLSVALALSLVHAGARGKSRDEIRDVIAKGSTDEQLSQHFSALTSALKNSGSKAEFHIANRAFVKKDFKINPSYLPEIENLYQAKAQNLDFENGKEESANVINGFVKDTTKGLIPEVVNSDSFKDVVLMLVNALYFKSAWKTKFEKYNTKQLDFFKSEANSQKVDFMSLKDKKHRYAENDQVQVLSMAYENKDFAFNVFLPKERFGLANFRKQLTSAQMTTLFESLAEKEANIKLPKFKITSDVKMTEILVAIGLKDMFDDSADLSGIGDNLKVSKVIHKAVIEVNEFGTEAAAAIVVAVVMKSMHFSMNTPVEFKADHPFLFTLTYKNHIVFIGEYHGAN